MPVELSQLQDLECYVKLPGDYPSTKIQMDDQKPGSLKTEPFLLKEEKKREYAVSLPANVELPHNAEALQEAESTEDIPENKEALV